MTMGSQDRNGVGAPGGNTAILGSDKPSGHGQFQGRVLTAWLVRLSPAGQVTPAERVCGVIVGKLPHDSNAAFLEIPTLLL